MEHDLLRARLAAHFKIESGGPGLVLGPGAGLPMGDAAAFITDVLQAPTLLEMMGLAAGDPSPGETAAAAPPVKLPAAGISIDALTLLPPTDDDPCRLSLTLVWNVEDSARIDGVDALSSQGMDFALKQMRATIDIVGPSVSLALSARLVFNHLELDLAAELPACVFAASLGAADSANDPAQRQLMQSYLPAPRSSSEPAASAAKSGPTLHALNLVLLPRDQSVMLHFEVDNLFSLPPFTLKVVQADIIYSSKSKSGRLWTELEIALGADTAKPPIEMILLAELDASGGWHFEGRTGPDGIQLGELMTAFGGSGGVVLPRALTTLDIVELSLAYDSTGNDRSFHFCVEVRLQVDDSPVDVTIRLSLESGAAHATDFSASARIGAHEFDIDFVKSTQAGPDGSEDWESALIALYKSASADKKDQPDLHSMVEELSSDLAVIVPRITVPKAIFGYHSQHKAGVVDSAWLFGVELGFGIDFSVSDLPVVSALFGDELRFGLDKVQLLLTTRPLTQDVLAQLPHLDEFTLPNGALNRACLSAELHLGTTPYPLLLNLGGAAPAAATVPGTADAEPVVTATAAAAAAPATAPVAVPSTAVSAPAAASDDTVWIPVQKHLSLLYVERIGVRYHGGQVGLVVGASLTASGLTISLDGLSIESPLTGLHPSFGLSGLGIAYKGGPVDVSGAFLRRELPLGIVEYSGQALVKAASFTLSAVGAYASVHGSPSMFIFAFLDKPLGGPGCFFVTGLAAGFGYNRSLRIPLLADVPAFPLIKAVMSAQAGANPFAGKADDPSAALSVLDDYIAPARGDNWLAVGVRFTSFKVVQSFALLTVSFGSAVEINLLGLSTLTMPTELPPGQEPVGSAQLALRVSYSADHGILSAAAQLTSESYILSKAVHLTGGFALCMWFKNQTDGAQAGDFVLTLGGYHPRYVKPAHYPDAPPIGFNWTIDDLDIKGGLYFALTPSAVMAGGYLDAVWQSGSIRAWFQAYADFLLSWKPFHYDVAMGLSIGASFRVNLLVTSFTMTIHVGVSLALWGPPFGGTATVDLSVISFTVAFGGGAAARPPISWAEFRQSFLPPVLAAAAPAKVGPVPADSGNAGLPKDYAGLSVVATDTYCRARIAAGLTKTPAAAADGQAASLSWVVNGSAFELVVESVIPVRRTRIWVDDSTPAVLLHEWLVYQDWLFKQPALIGWLDEPDETHKIARQTFEKWKLGTKLTEPAWSIELGPVGVAAADFESELFVAVRKLNGGAEFLPYVKVDAHRSQLPKSLWSVDAALHTTGDSLTTLNADSAGGLVDASTGLSFTPHIVCDKSPLAIDVHVLQDEIEAADHAGTWSRCGAAADEVAGVALLAVLAGQLAIDAGAVFTPPSVLMRQPPWPCRLGAL